MLYYFEPVWYPIIILVRLWQTNSDKQISQKIRGEDVNKLELINELKDECQISKKEAAAIVDIFFDKIPTALAEGDRVEIHGLCSFLLKNISPIKGGIPKPERPSPGLAKNCRFLKSEKN
jgi:integration host factor subunit beta